MDFKDDELTNEEIMKLIQKYKNKRTNEKKYYHNVTKTKEEFKVKNRENAKKHYEEKGREMKKEKYVKNKDIIKAKALYNYYLKNDNIDGFKDKHKDRYILLLENNKIKN
tara:strand:+ start:1549 stop:1878 length:330 start_codon:yes stop_codon:yes gene_type:complete